MAIAGLFEHRVAHFRPVESRTAMGSTETWTTLIAAGSGVNNAKVTEPDMTLQVNGSGDEPVGSYIVSMLPANDVRERDVFRVMSGPETSPDPTVPVFLRVVSSNKPRGHHVKAICTRLNRPPKDLMP